MSQMLNLDNELLRICPEDATKLQYSINGGKHWATRSPSSTYGEFEDLIDNGDEILAQTSKGLYYSKNAGRHWSFRSR